jgi:hypothetical protein
VAAPTETGTDSAPIQVAASFDAFLIAFETPFEWVHKCPSLSREDKKEETLRFLPESLLSESKLFS